MKSQQPVAAASGGSFEPWHANLGQTVLELANERTGSWWTGLAPERCPGWQGQHLEALPALNVTTCTRAEVQAYFANGWTLTELLFAGLKGEEAFYRPPYHSLRYPMIFYYAHPAVLYVNKLRLAELQQGALDAYFEAIFETGVDEMRWDDMAKNEMRWPSVDAVWAYRQKVYQLVSAVIASHPDLAPGHPPLNMQHPLWALLMGFEHERIHLETSSVLVRELPLRLVQRPPEFAPLHPSWRTETPVPVPVSRSTQPLASVESGAFVAIEPGTVRLGKAADVPHYGWDNEYGDKTAVTAGFYAAKELVTNADYWRFVHAGGYSDEALWSAEGWSWRRFRNTKWPAFWVQDGPASSHRYRLRTLFEEIAIPWNWPVVVNHHEALAYAHWLTREHCTSGQDHYRLITEAEHHQLRKVAGGLQEDGHWQGANAGLRFSSEAAVDADAARDKGVRDLFGNLWQWCGDHFHPLSGFRVHRYYEDFSTPCFDGEHFMILGGSFASTGHEAQEWARFHFRPHFTQHAGIRLVRSKIGEASGAVRLTQGQASVKAAEGSAATSYETDSILNDYMLMHFGASRDQMPYAFGPQGVDRFPQRCAELGLKWVSKLQLPLVKALDIGCAVGAATFRLAEEVEDEALGIDLSHAFIDAATALKDQGRLAYFQREEGEIGVWREAEASAKARAKARFQRGDATSLSPDLAGYDLVLLANLVCRIPAPRSCLARMGGLNGVVRPGGLLVVTCPFTWMEAYTPREAWLGGKIEAGAERHSEAGLISALGPDFELLERSDLPLVIREHRRKFQYVVPLALVFRRRS